MDTKFDKNLKNALLDVFRRSIDFFSNHSMEWWACGGTAIGAVRHKGLIPWDDDVDIYMSRSSYDELLHLTDALYEETGLKLLSIHSHPDYNHSFAKIYNPSTTIWEQEIFPYTYGIWVDIFILDESNKGAWTGSKDCQRFKSLFSAYQKTVANYSIQNICFSLLNFKLKDALSMIKTKFHSPQYKKAVYEKFLQLENELQSEEGVNYVDYAEGSMGFFNKSWFETSVVMPFEDFEINMPVGYDAYLKHLYGDYMTPPPVDKRYSGHSFCYVNLQEGLSLKEVKQRIKKGEKSGDTIFVGCKPFTLRKILDRITGKSNRSWL